MANNNNNNSLNNLNAALKKADLEGEIVIKRDDLDNYMKSSKKCQREKNMLLSLDQ